MKSFAGILGGGAALLAMASVAAPADAAKVLVTFTGNYNVAYFGTQTGAISGSFVYDTALGDNSQAAQANAITSFSLTSKIVKNLYGQQTVDQTFSGAVATITYSPDLDGQGADRFQVDFALGTVPQVRSLFTLDLNWPLGTFSPDAYGVPASLPPLASLSSKNIVLNDTQGDLSIGTLDTFTMQILADDVSPAPEPATWAMMVGGFGVIGGALRRRQRQAVRVGFAV